MTEEETARFALVLLECERIRAMMAEDEASRSNGGDEGIPTGIPTGVPTGIPVAAVPTGRWYPDPSMVAAA